MANAFLVEYRARGTKSWYQGAIALKRETAESAAEVLKSNRREPTETRVIAVTFIEE